ncbi:hypothetical protein TNCV_3721101 [Trichonephila clavipes]|nr:hypothetical protein TNCV_3721101 [Trichonephila clavipes]
MSITTGHIAQQACHNPDCRMSGCIYDSSWRTYLSISTHWLDGIDKSAGVGSRVRSWKLSTFVKNSFFSEHVYQESFDSISNVTSCSILRNITGESAFFARKNGTTFSCRSVKNARFAHLLPPFSTHLLETVFQRRGPLMKEPVNPHHTVTLGECSIFSVFTHGFDVT